MNDDIRRKFLDESHDRAVLQAMSDATDDLRQRRKERQVETRETVEIPKRELEELKQRQ